MRCASILLLVRREGLFFCLQKASDVIIWEVPLWLNLARVIELHWHAQSANSVITTRKRIR